MPQFDVSSFGTQLFWLTLAFGILYIAISKLIVPKAESIIINRNRYLEENITASENDYGKIEFLRKEKEIKLRKLNIEIEKLRKEAIDSLDANFASRTAELNEALSRKTKESFLDVQKYLASFHKHENESCIDLAVFIIEKITNKPADLKILEKIYREK
jgi:F-type H+-transporting ATPase subunit b